MRNKPLLPTTLALIAIVLLGCVNALTTPTGDGSSTSRDAGAPAPNTQAANYAPVLPKTVATTSVIVLDMTKDTAVSSDLYRDLQYVYLTIQGIVNRTSSTKIYFNNYGAGYVGKGSWAHENFKETQYYLDDGLVPVPRTTPSLNQNSTHPVLEYLLQNYSSSILGKVRIPGFAQLNDSAVMAGLTACAIENAIPVSDAADSVITGLGYSFAQKADTRNMNSTDAFNWAKNNYFRAETNRKVIGYHATLRDDVTLACLDYLIANRAFIYGLNLEVASNRTLASTVVNASNYAPGTTVVTSHEAFGINEYHYGQGYPIEICLVANYSVHSSFPSLSSIITAPAPTQIAPIDNNTVYVAFYVTDGDSARYGSTFHYDYQRNSENYCNHGRELPIGWSMTATAFDLFPNMLKWKSEHTNNGKWEYTATSFHGDGVPGTTQQATDNFLANYRNYLDNTNGLFKGVNFFQNGTKEKLAASNLGFGYFIRGYQGNETTSPDWQYDYNVPSVQLVAGTQNSTSDNNIQAIRYAVNTFPTGQPAFVLSTISDGGDFVYKNCSHCPFKLSSEVAANLNANPPNGRKIVYLKPSELFATWKAYRGYGPTPPPPPPGTGTLLSQGRPVTVDSAVEPGANAVDGDFDEPYWTSANTLSPHWISVDMGSSKTISQVKLYWAEQATSYKIQTSSNASTWTDIYSTASGPGGIETLNISGTGRYVRMYATAGIYPNVKLAEFQVYGGDATTPPPPPPPVTGTLLSQGRPVTVDTAVEPGANAVDGDFDEPYWTSANTLSPHWIYVDMGSSKTISQVKLYWAEQATSYKIQTSSNASTWTDIYSTASGPGGIETLNISGTGRYVRMYATAGIYPNVKLAEFQVYGGDATTPPPPPPPVTGALLSQGQPVTVDTAVEPGANAVDGDFDEPYWTSANTLSPHWISVDLGSSKTISQVKLYWAEQATSYKIQTSSNASTWTDIYSTASGPGGIETLNISGTGRYVRMYATAGIYPNVKLAEFQVFGSN